MKKIFLRFTKSPRGLRLWLLVHLGIPVLLGLSVFFAGPVRINTQLQDMLPQGGQSKAAAEADRLLGARNGREAVILAAAPELKDAKEGAVFLYREFVNSPQIEEISFYFDSSALARLTGFVYDYRFVIAGKETQTLLETGRAPEIAEDALAAAYGAFNFVPLDNIEKDPFLLTERAVGTLLSSASLAGGDLGLKDDVLAAHVDETWYVLLRMTLAPGAVSVSGGKNIVSEIYTAAASAKKAVSGLDLYFSGVPFHSYESSSNAQKEITFISIITLIMILALFLYFFRTPLPVFLSVLAAGISVGMAAAAAFLVFREVHIITFVFGTTLIGTCIDYSIHFFVHWKANTELKDGYAIRSYIKKSIIMCFVSTEVCFAAFLFAPFPLLKQFAVFSMAGILSSFLTSYYLYPLLTMPAEAKRKLYFSAKNFSLPPALRIALIAALAAAGLAILIISPQGMKIKNDIGSLYTMSASMLESEKRAARVLDRGASFWYFIVSGSSPQETLEREEALIRRLEDASAAGSFLGTSLFVPSVKTQQKTYEAMRALLPLAPAQYKNLGFPPEYVTVFNNEFAAGQRYCLPQDAPPDMGIANLWIGKAGTDYYSCVLPARPADESVFRAIADEFDFVYFMNKAQDISRDLDTLTRTILFFFAAAYLVILIVVFLAYPWRDSIKICAVPFFLVLAALAVLAANAIPLGFFSIAALILVFGLGLDYIFYMTGKSHGPNSGLTPVAVLLSFLTTLFAFGALAFSSFTPVHIFGLTVCAGLSAAFISAMLLQGSHRQA